MRACILISLMYIWRVTVQMSNGTLHQCKRKDRELSNWRKHLLPTRLTVNARLITGIYRARHCRSHVRFPISDVTDMPGFKETGKGSFARMKHRRMKYRWLDARSTSATLVDGKRKRKRPGRSVERREKGTERERERKQEHSGEWTREGSKRFKDDDLIGSAGLYRVSPVGPWNYKRKLRRIDRICVWMHWNQAEVGGKTHKRRYNKKLLRLHEQVAI